MGVSSNANQDMKKMIAIDQLMGSGHFRHETNIPLITMERQWKKGDGTDALFFEWDFNRNHYHVKPRQLLLFNDLLVCTEPTNSHHHPLAYCDHFYARNLSVCETTETHLLIHDSTRGVRAYKIDDETGMTDSARKQEVGKWITEIKKAKQSVDECDSHAWSDRQTARLKKAAEEEGIDL